MKSSVPRFLCIAALLSSTALVAQTSPVAPALCQAIEISHAAWKQDGGAEFKSGLTYVQGEPTLMVITTKSEAADKKLRRKRSIVAACEFLLDDAAFSKATIAVVE